MLDESILRVAYALLRAVSLLALVSFADACTGSREALRWREQLNNQSNASVNARSTQLCEPLGRVLSAEACWLVCYRTLAAKFAEALIYSS